MSTPFYLAKGAGARGRRCLCKSGSPLLSSRRNHGASILESRPNIGQGPVRNKAGRRPEKDQSRMANILVNIEKGIEIGAEDALKWLTGADKALHAAPAVVAALATLIGAVEKPLAELAGAASNPLNIALDIQTVTDLRAAWPDVQAFLKTLGVKRSEEHTS